MKKPVILLIDASSLIFRAFFAIPHLSTKSGKPTNVLHGLARMLTSLLRNPCDYAAACLDRPEPTFRHEKYAEYKAHRPPVPDALTAQFAPAYEMMEGFGIRCVEKQGYEADDIIATLCGLAGKENMDAQIITGDMDALQLVSPHVKVCVPAKGVSAPVEYDEVKVKERYGITPLQMTDYKALVGDPSDNIKGVPGIGQKTAAQLLNRYGNLEHLIECMHELPEKVKVRLKEHQQQALLNKELVTLRHDVPVEIKKDDLRYRGIQIETLQAFFAAYEMKATAAHILQNHADAELRSSKETGKNENASKNESFSEENKQNTQLELL